MHALILDTRVDMFLSLMLILPHTCRCLFILLMLPAAGDAKTYNHLRSLKKEHSDDLKWLLPMPGDWHTLKNYQPLFMTVYSDASLK